MKIEGTFIASTFTYTINGDWYNVNGTFTHNTSTVDFTGTGSIDVGPTCWGPGKKFHNINAAATGQTTTVTGACIGISNVLSLDTGIVVGNEVLLDKDIGTPLLTNGATLSNSRFKYDGDGPVIITPTTYPDLWVAGNALTNNYTLGGNIACNTLRVYGNGLGNETVLNTDATNNHSITCNTLIMGLNGTPNTYSTLKLNNSNVNLSGSLSIFASDGSGVNAIDADTATITVSGNWTNNDSFTADTSTVIFDGSNQAINGSTTFYNLTKSVASADTLTFDAAGTQSIAAGGHVSFNGAADNLLRLRSSSTPTQWGFNVDAGATTDIHYVDVQDSDASAGATVSAYFSQQPSANNLNWSFENLQLVKQVWIGAGSPICLASRPAKADCNSGATTTVVPVGITIYFLIYVSNVSNTVASNGRITDQLDDSNFTYIPNTLQSTATGLEPAATASSIDIFNATTAARSDAFDGDTGSDEFTGINTNVSPDNLTAGGNGGVGSNDTINIPANKTFAIRFQATKN